MNPLVSGNPAEPVPRPAQHQPHPACVVCGGSNWVSKPDDGRLIRVREGYAVVQCQSCQLRRLDPMPNQDELKAFYTDDSLKHAYQETGGTAYVVGDTAAKAYVNERLQQLAAVRGGAGHILDIGAAQGAFLHQARQLGWTPLGLELSPEGVDFARANYGIELRQQTLHEAQLPDASFDAVHLSHVLEHLPDPLETVAEIRRILKPGGVVAIEVPNEFDDLFQVMRRRVLRRPQPPYAVPCPHVYFYTPANMRRLLAQTGFDVFHYATPRRNADIASSYPGGGLVRRAIFALEQATQTGPLIEVYGRKP